ncbi:hypothetical protein DINM_001354 [Dirofilaria immitis]|nr:hypothetical protein [Dirofilaria immitis]
MRKIDWNWHQMLYAAILLMKGHLNSVAIIDDDSDMNRLSANTEKCTTSVEQSISECLQPVLNYAGKFQNTMGLPLQGTDIFRELCDVYSHFKICTNGIKCSSISIEAIDASYGYMCGAGYESFENYATCFAEVETEISYMECKNDASAAIALAQKTKIPNDYNQYFEILCTIMDHYLRCCHPVINKHCGQGAWELVRTVTLDSLRVTMPKCDLHNALL